jgi:glycolate oxidase
VLEKVYEIADRHQLIVVNVFHAGDGNLHPLLLFDPRDPGVLERVHAAGDEIVSASLDAGGVLSGEHGIGVEKQAYMSRMFSSDDLDHQNRLRRSFDPTCRSNPGKVLPSSHSCADIQALRAMPTGVWG